MFLPKFLEEKIGSHANASSRLESLQEYCIYTIAGSAPCKLILIMTDLGCLLFRSLPGSLVGAALEHYMGRKEAMTVSTFATSLGVFGFVFVNSRTAVMLTSIWISFSGTLMYAIICTFIPLYLIFEPS